MNPTTAVVAAYVVPYYLKRGDSDLLYMDVGQEVTDMARKIISCETEYEGKEDSGEMFPQWASLVCCPRTYNLIEWREITKEINRISDAIEEAKRAKAWRGWALIVGIALIIDPFATLAGMFFSSCLHDGLTWHFQSAEVVPTFVAEAV